MRRVWPRSKRKWIPIRRCITGLLTKKRPALLPALTCSALGRTIGLPPAQVFRVAATAPYSPITGITLEQALHTALAERPDYQSSKKLVEAAQQTLAAARAEWYPTVDVNGYFGATGPSPANSHSVFSVTASLNFNIYNGGRIHADVEK